MTTIILRQSLGNTEPRSANVIVKNIPLYDYEVDNNFNNLNNNIEINSGLIQIVYNTANSAYDMSNTKFSSNGGNIYGDVIVNGNIKGNNQIIINSVYANSYYGIIDAGIF